MASPTTINHERGKSSFGTRLKSLTVDKLDSFFYNYGCAVGNHPWRFIVGSIILTLFCCLGLFRFHQEKHPMKLWIPPESEFAKVTDWLMKEFKEGYRLQYLLLTADNVLQKDVLLKLLRIRNQIIESQLDNVTLSDVCFKIPVVNIFRRKKRSSNGLDQGDDDDEEIGIFKLFDDFDKLEPSVHLSPVLYCSVVDNFRKACFERSILEFWNYDEEIIDMLSQDDIIETLNTTSVSPVYGLPMEYNSLIGGVERDESGKIVKAKAILSLWTVHVNFSNVNMDKVGNDGGTADWATDQGLRWEKSFLNTIQNLDASDLNGTKIYYEAGRSFGDISNSVMFQDIDKILIGVMMMYIYVLFVLSPIRRLDCLTLRMMPAGGGMACIGLSFISACGICSALGISYGPVHTSLPFLLMGIGVDDMFVIMACKDHLSNDQKNCDLPTQMGLTLRHAGVSILITSLTDMIATCIGGTTILPALESFCYFASAGVFITFIYQCTFFLAFVVLDEKRLANKRNVFIPCIQHENKKSKYVTNKNETYSKNLMHYLFSKILLTATGKVLIILITLALLVIGTTGLMNLKQKFDPKWFLPQESYLVKFINEREKWFPDMGQDAGIYFGRLNYSADFYNMYKVVNQIQNEPSITYFDNWCDDFINFVNYYYKKDLPNEILSDDKLRFLIGKFLFSTNGAKYTKNFRFDGTLKCGEPTPPITVASFDFKFKLFSGPEQSLPAMNRIKDILKTSNVTSGDNFKAVWGKVFAHWVTDEVIQGELYRNLVLACICVMATTSIIILNINLCFWVFISVLLTLIDVCGVMYYWGMTIDIVSCIALVIAVGLCVDYAAHIGHTFLECQGTRHDRILETMDSVGNAVINGGFSTLLAMSMLAFSEAHVFQSFFKIFLLVVVFGLFHGVVFLPIILSFLGPTSSKKVFVIHTFGDNVQQRSSCEVEMK